MKENTASIESSNKPAELFGEKLAFNLTKIAKWLGNSPDVVIREFSIGPPKEAINGAIGAGIHQDYGFLICDRAHGCSIIKFAFLPAFDYSSDNIDGYLFAA